MFFLFYICIPPLLRKLYYGSYNKYSRSQFHRFKRNPLLPKTENGEYMTYDQYAYERDK
jgi:hypothetical protein